MRPEPFEYRLVLREMSRASFHDTDSELGQRGRSDYELGAVGNGPVQLDLAVRVAAIVDYRVGIGRKVRMFGLPRK